MTKPEIIETTDATFELDVIERSRLAPVVVDFWAEWCAPCRALGPILEKVAEDFNDRITLVKADTEQCPQAAGTFQVSGIPAVFGVFDGEVVDSLQGAVGEDVVRAFFQKMADYADMQTARQLEQTQPDEALKTYRKLIEENPTNANAMIGCARIALASGDLGAVEAIVIELEERGFLEPEAEKLKSAIALAKAGKSINLEEIKEKSDANPEDLDLMLQLARAYAGAEQHEIALQTCLKIMETQKVGIGDDARKLMLDIFKILPDDSPLIGIYRRKLAMLLY